MRKIFIVSLCYKGLIGGKLELNENEIIYSTNKLTIDKKYRKIKISLKDIKYIKKEKLFILPIFCIVTKEDEVYKFLIFNVKKFMLSVEKNNIKIN